MRSKTTAAGFERREFLALAGAAGVAAGLAPATRVGAADVQSPARKIKLGLIGCGGRGGWLADLFAKHGGYELVAVHDYFQDRADGVGGKHNVPENRRFTGLDGYKRLLDTKPEAVAIITPPYFHPVQAAAAVEAGAHVYLAKPIAVDVPGCLSIEASGAKAAAAGHCFLVDFQTRANGFYKEAVKRVHDGAIGPFVFGQAGYHCGRLGIKATPGTPEARLRNWVFDKVLSGDIITEQNIHALDVMSWIMNTPPLHAFGTGGRKVRTDVGDCWDYFTLLYQYAENVGVTFSSRQFDAEGPADGIVCKFFGHDGVIETQYGGNVMIRGKNFYRGGKTGQIYLEGAQTNIAAFYDAIAAGKGENATVSPSVRSNLVTILGRKAAYGNKLVTWDELMADTTRLEPDLSGLKA